MSPTASRARRTGDARQRKAMYRDELVQRAGMYFRLGYPPSRAIARLRSNLAWDFEGAGKGDGFSEKDVAEIVKATYLRRPTR
jgi:hypothetical protein